MGVAAQGRWTASLEPFEQAVTSIAQYASPGTPTEEDQFALPESRHESKTTQRVIVSSQNVEIAKKAYEAYGAGDVETALSTFDDDVEWSVPGNSTLSGTYRGKEKFKELLGKLAEKSFTTTPDRILGDGDDVVVITKITAGGESGLQADVLITATASSSKP